MARRSWVTARCLRIQPKPHRDNRGCRKSWSSGESPKAVSDVTTHDIEVPPKGLAQPAASKSFRVVRILAKAYHGQWCANTCLVLLFVNTVTYYGRRRPVYGEFLNAAKIKGLRILVRLPECTSFWSF